MLTWLKKYKIVIGIILFVLLWSLFFYFFSPESLVDRIGFKNSYLIIFIIGLVAGVSSFTGTSYFASLVTFAQGGVNPWILGLAGGLGLFLSDSIFYLLARKGIRVIGEHKSALFEKIKGWLENLYPPYVYLGIFAYAGFLPLPNDILLIALAVSSISYKKFMWPLLAGSLTVSIIWSLIGV